MNTKLDEIKSFWGSALKTIPARVLEPFNLSSTTRYFLEDIGLPSDLSVLRQTLEVNFYFDNNNIKPLNHKGIRYCNIGDDLGSAFCISPADDCLYSIDLKDDITNPVCFVNSSIWQFVLSLQTFSRFQQLANEGKASETDVVESMKNTFRDIDPNSLVHKQTWWSIVVDQPY